MEVCTYDDNGNMTEDKNKGIASISYNILNLPEVITFDDTSVLTYSYTSSGAKLKEVYTAGSSTTTREYVSGMLYINNVRQYLQTETGRVTTSSGFTYVHNLSDHQGNIRASFQNNGSGTATLTQENHYYPFGLTMESFYSGTGDNHLYSAKEWKNQNGEAWYDFGWRNYDAALGRWFNADPISEFFNTTSLYSYCFNDPINFVDLKGLSPTQSDGSDGNSESSESDNSSNILDASGWFINGFFDYNSMAFLTPSGFNMYGNFIGKKNKPLNGGTLPEVTVKASRIERRDHREDFINDWLEKTLVGVGISTEAAKSLAKLNLEQLKKMQELLAKNNGVNAIKINDQILKVVRVGKVIKGISVLGGLASILEVANDIANQNGEITIQNGVDGVIAIISLTPAGWIVSPVYLIYKEATKDQRVVDFMNEIMVWG